MHIWTKSFWLPLSIHSRSETSHINRHPLPFHLPPQKLHLYSHRTSHLPPATCHLPPITRLATTSTNCKLSVEENQKLSISLILALIPKKISHTGPALLWACINAYKPNHILYGPVAKVYSFRQKEPLAFSFQQHPFN